MVYAQNTQPPDQAPATIAPESSASSTEQNSSFSDNTLAFADPSLTTGISNVTSDISNSTGGQILSFLGAGSGTLVALRGAPSTTAPPAPPTTTPPAPTPTAPFWPSWARPVVGWITRQGQSFWQGLLRVGQRTIAPGFRLVVERGQVVLKWVVGGVTVAKMAIASIIAGAVVLLWQAPAHAPTAPPESPDQPDPEPPTPPAPASPQPAPTQQTPPVTTAPPPQAPPTVQPAPQPQLPAEFSQWQAQAQQFEQNVVNGVYSNSSQDYQAASAYLRDLQNLNQQLINQGLPAVTTQNYVDQVGARLRAGRYVSQISYHLREAQAGHTVDYEAFRNLTNDALIFSNRINEQWPGMGFYSSHERDNHLALVREFQIPDAPPTTPTEVPAPNTEPAPTNDPPEEEPPEEEPPNDPVPLPYVPDQVEPPTSTPVPDIEAQQPANSTSVPVPPPIHVPGQPSEEPFITFTPIPDLDRLLDEDNQPFIINPQPEEPVLVPNLVPEQPLPQVEPPPSNTPSSAPPIQANANGDQAGEHRPAPEGSNPGVEGPEGSAPRIGDEPEIEQPDESIDPDYGFGPLRALRESAENAADAAKRFWESRTGRILGAILGIGTSMTNPQQLPQSSAPDPLQPPAGPTRVEPPPPAPRSPYPVQPHQTIPQSPRRQRNDDEEDDSDEPTTGPAPDPDPPQPALPPAPAPAGALPPAQTDPDAPITPEIVPDDVELPPMRSADPDATFQMPGPQANPSNGTQPALPPAPAPSGILTPAPGGPPALPPAPSPNPSAPTSPPFGLPNNPQPGSTTQNALPPAQTQPSPPAADPQQELRDILGDTPPVFKLASNDAQFGYAGAHTLDRHGPNIPLNSSNPNARTIESRVVDGRGTGWGTTQNFSYRWVSESTANEIIDKHVVENWDDIRESLVQRGSYVATFDAGRLAGEGFYNQNAYVGGTRVAVPDQTSHVTVVIRLDPITQTIPYVHTSFPTYQPLSDSNYIIINDVDSP
ncbi:MAG: hypothetical protein AAGF95_03040 [Chloroflexota bacterium]